ncbi:MAG: hypothetical protein ACOC5K_00565 [Chloroflexota bacterium]
MPIALSGSLEVESRPAVAGRPVWTRLVVTNDTASSVSVPNPHVGDPPDELDWSFSFETYRASLLISFGILKVSVMTDSEESLQMQGPNPWITPLMPARLDLAPRESFSLRINLSDHFAFPRAGTYRLTVVYGDDLASATATADLSFEEPQSQGN